MSDAPLARRIGFPMLVVYGVGTMVGGGFYALLGRVAVAADGAVVPAILASSIVAGLAASTFAEMSSRYPVSAGEAAYVEAAWGSPRLAQVTGWLVALTGTVSAATLCAAFGLFAVDLTGWPATPVAVAVAVALAGLAAWGIEASVWFAAGVTALEVGGLLVVLALRGDALAALPAHPEVLWPADAAAWSAVGSGAFLAFYAFVGFEDMVNLAEEVNDAPRTMPRGIVWAVLLTTVLYVLVATVAVLSVDLGALGESRTPLGVLVGGSPGAPALWVVLVSMLAGVNGALVQLVMGSRVLYGLARRGQAPAMLGAVHPVRRTPLNATAAVALAVVALVLTTGLEPLARVTSLVLLVVFGLVGASMARVVRRDGPHPDAPGVPWGVGVASALACAVFVGIQVVSWAGG